MKYVSKTALFVTKSLGVALFLMLGASVLKAQPSQLTISAQPPPPALAGGSVVGQTGGTPLYYWVVTHYPIGNVVSPLTQVNGTVGAQNLNGTNFVRLQWSGALSSATGFDVLRGTTPTFPGPCAACAVLLNTNVSTVNDQGSGSAYTQSSSVVSPAVGVITLDNVDSPTPFAQIAINGGAPATINTGTPAPGGITRLTGDVAAGPGGGSQAATIQPGVVTLGKQANLAANSIEGNNTGAPATPIALTVAQVNTMLGTATPSQIQSNQFLKLTITSNAPPNYTGTVSGLTALTDGMVLWLAWDTFNPISTCDGVTNLTLNINGLGAKPLVGVDNSDIYTSPLSCNGLGDNDGVQLLTYRTAAGLGCCQDAFMLGPPLIQQFRKLLVDNGGGVNLCTGPGVTAPCQQLLTAALTGGRTVHLPDADSTTVVPSTGGAGQFATAISSGGVVSYGPAATPVQVQNNQFVTLTVGGASPNYTATTTPGFAAYVDGMVLWYSPVNGFINCDGVTSLTLAVNGLAALPLYGQDGNDIFPAPLAQTCFGEIGGWVPITYNAGIGGGAFVIGSTSLTPQFNTVSATQFFSCTGPGVTACTNLTAIFGLLANPLSQFAATTSAQLRGIISDESGTGAALFQNGDIGAATGTSLQLSSFLSQPGIAFASLAGTLTAAGMQIYCTDCTVTSGVNDTCANAGSGALAANINGVIRCRI